jgi:hypothetical protein
MHGFFNLLDVMPAAREALRFVVEAIPTTYSRVSRNEAT